MAIDPLGSGSISEPGKKPVTGVTPPKTDAPASAARAAATDSVEVSEAARQLASPDIPSGTISGEALRDISARIADGSYNSDAVIDAIARNLPDNLG